MVTFRALVVSNSSGVSLCLGWQLGCWRVFLNVPDVSSDVGLPCQQSPPLPLVCTQCEMAVICHLVFVRLLVSGGGILYCPGRVSVLGKICVPGLQGQAYSPTLPLAATLCLVILW